VRRCWLAALVGVRWTQFQKQPGANGACADPIFVDADQNPVAVGTGGLAVDETSSLSVACVSWVAED
jgi:hypothetical protein